ncbi:hypothetical protein [Helcococcus bovis]|uniref:Uncharacterized protein n=1 Tax=Helcococcus bovis TaxID=3153252 RepID=A0ABW9F7E4_9FIRM
MGGEFITKSECARGLGLLGISPGTYIAMAGSYVLAKKLIGYVSNISGIAGKIVGIILSWAAGQVINFGLALARGAINRGVDVYWNWNIFREPIGVGYSVKY